jgi:hypothetical protein
MSRTESREMKSSELFKFDVRVRERMLKKGLISDKELATHLESLTDRATVCDDVRLDQPALGRHDPIGVRQRESNGAEGPSGHDDHEDEA